MSGMRKHQGSKTAAPSNPGRELMKALQAAADDIDEGPFRGGGCERACVDLLRAMVAAADSDGIVRLTWTELGRPAQHGPMFGLRLANLLSGKSGRYRLYFASIFALAACRRRKAAADEAAERAFENVMAACAA